jgi:hypothetical protein
MVEGRGKRTFKVSPKGIINLATSTLREIGVARGSGQRVRVTVNGNDVVISAANEKGADSVRISPRGVIELPDSAHAALGSRYGVKEQGQQRVVLTRA